LLVRRLLNDNKNHAVLSIGQESGKAEAQKMVGEQFQRMWEELAKGKLRAEGSKAGRLLARTLSALSNIDEGKYFIEVFGTILIDRLH
jgi:hypothetical protein